MASANDSTATLKVEGWGCEGCSSATEAALRKVPGVKAVSTNLDNGTATVSFDDAKASVADLEKAVTSAGYKVVK